MAKYWSKDVEDDYDYYADDAEAVVYMIMSSGRNNRNCLYVMRRADAIRFCERPETSGHACQSRWAYAFTTYRRDWRDTPNDFRADDGRFNELLKNLGIKVIWRKGMPVPAPEVVPQKTAEITPMAGKQLSLFAVGA